MTIDNVNIQNIQIIDKFLISYCPIEVFNNTYKTAIVVKTNTLNTINESKINNKIYKLIDINDNQLSTKLDLCINSIKQLQ